MVSQIARKDIASHPEDMRSPPPVVGAVAASDTTGSGPAPPLDPLVIALARAVDRIGRTAS